MSLTSIQKDFFVKSGLTVLGNNTATSSTSNTSTLQVDGGAGIAKNVIIGTTLEVGGATSLYGNLSVTGGTNLGVTTASQLTVTGRTSLQDLSAGATTATTLNVTGDTTLNGDLAVNGGDITSTAATFNFLNANVTTATLLASGTNITIGGITGATTFRNLTTVSNTTNSTLTTTGALVVTGGVGIGQDLRVGGTIYGTATTASNLSGGATGSIPYQTAAGTTAFIPIGVNGYLLQSNGTTATWTPLSGVSAGLATTASNLANGAQYQIPYQTGVGGTSFEAGFEYNYTSDTFSVTNAIINGLTQSASTATGAFQVRGGVGVAGNIFVGGTATATNVLVSGTTQAGTTATGALTVPFGGVGIGGNLVVGGASTLTGAVIVQSTTQAGTTNTGALTVPFGGVGVGGNLVVGGSSTVTNSQVILGTTQAGTTATGALTVPFGGVGVGGNLVVGGVTTVTNITGATSTATGALQVRGGVATWENLFVGGNSNITGGEIVGGDLSVNGGDIITNQTTFNLLNTTATTLNFAGAATAITVGATTGATTIRNNTTVTSTTVANSTLTGAFRVVGGVAVGQDLFVGNTATILSTAASTSTLQNNAVYVAGGVGIEKSLYVKGAAVFQNDVLFIGTTTYVYSTQTIFTDNLLNLHTPPGGPAGSWTLDDTEDIGLIFHYYSGSDKDAFLGLANDTKYLEWYDTGVESTGTVTTFTSATYGIFKTGGAIFVNTTSASSTATGALQVPFGGAGIGGDVYIGKTLNVAGVETVTNTTGATSTNTGALVVRGGAGIWENLFVGGNSNITGGEIVGGDLSVNGGDIITNQTTFNLINTTATTLNFAGAATALTVGATTGATTIRNNTTITSITNAGSTLTGALQVLGGIGVGKDIYVGGGATILGTITGTVTTSSNLAGGATGSIPYQTGAGTTAFIPIGTNGFILSSNGTTATWTSMSGLSAGQATTASNIAGGAQYQIPYQTGAGSTAFEAGFEYNYTSNLFTVDNIRVNGTIQGGSTSTGSLVVPFGGVGIGGNLVVGGVTTVTNATAASSTQTGALIVAGGIGIGQSSFIGGNETITGNLAVNGGNITSTAATFNFLTSNVTTATLLAAGTDITIGATTGATTIRNATTVTNTTAASSTNTGALVVRGGAGIWQNLYVGGDLDVAGGDITSAATTFNLLNSGVTTANVLGAGTNITIGATTGATVIRNDTTVTSTTQANSTLTGAFEVRGGVGIGGNIFVDGVASIAGLTTITNITQSASTGTGALQVRGGVGVGGNIVIGGSSTITNSEVILGTTQAGTTSTGALTVPFGGAGIGGNLVVGGSSTFTGITRVLDTTNAVATNDGAFRVSGGVSVVKDIYAGGVITAGATAAATTGSTVNGVFYNNTMLSSWTSNPITSTAGQNLDSFSTSTYRSAKYFCQVSMGSSFYITEISVFHDAPVGTKAYISEYGMSYNTSALGTFDATLVSNNVTLTFTPTTSTSMVVKLSRLAMTV